MGKNDKTIINAWCMYDWANSVYSLVISTAIFPIYYSAATKSAYESEMVTFFSMTIKNTVLYEYSLSFSFLLIASLSPLLSGIADYGGRKMQFMKFFTFLGGASCILLYFFTGINVEWGILFAMLASVGFAGSIVFYNAYLPIIATPDKVDLVSARGFSFGYAGSVLLLIFNLVTISHPSLFGLADNAAASRLSFVLVGVWWIGFAHVSFHFLPKDARVRRSTTELVSKGYHEILTVFRRLRLLKNMKRFLIAFFFYNMGVLTVIYLASLFGSEELDLSADILILTILIIQLVAIAGSYLFAKISSWKGNKFSLVAMIIIWMLVCGYAYFLESATQFYVLGFFVGLVMGGIQSLSRASYSKLIPAGTKDHTSYFSFYDVVEKLSTVVGTFAYGLIDHWTGSMRYSTLVLSAFFLIGLLFLLTTSIPRQAAIQQVER